MALLDGLGRAIQKLDCAVLGSAAYIFGSLNVLQGLDQGTAANVINGYRRLRGCDPANDPVPPPPPFVGGQCPEVYILSYTALRQTGAFFAAGSFAVLGPVGGLRVVTTNGTGSLQVFSSGVNVGDTTCPAIVSSGSPAWRSASLGGAGLANGSATITSLTPCGADNCGDPPPPPSPPINVNFDVDVEYVDEGDNIVNITIPVEFSPFSVNFNGDVSFPISFSLGGIDFNGDVSFGPEFDLNVRGPRFNKGGGESLPDGDPADDRPEAAPEANIVGAVVIAQTVSDNAATSIDFVNGPNIFAPRLGSLKFAYSLGGATFWSGDIDVKGDRTFIPCPFSQGADAIAVSPVPGVTLTATPIRGFPLATIGDIKVVLDTL